MRSFLTLGKKEEVAPQKVFLSIPFGGREVFIIDTQT